MNEAKERLDTYLEIHEELVEKCEDWVAELGYGRQIWDPTIQVHNHKYPPYITMTYMYEQEGSCGRYDTEGSEKIPLAVFWDDELIGREIKKRRDAQLKAMQERAEKEKVQAMKDKAKRYEMYLDLCKEFENEED